MEITNAQKTVQGAAVLEPLVPEPTAEFIEEIRTRQEAPPRPVPARIPVPIPTPTMIGSRLVIWRQDPAVGVLGRRLTYIRGLILDGPRDARIDTYLPGTTPVVRNADGDFIYPAGTPEADCAHTYAIVRQTVAMWQRRNGGLGIPWAWNTPTNTSALVAQPRAFGGANAFYSRNEKSLKFGFFNSSGRGEQVYTCRSIDIVAHQAGHAILDGLKPGWLGLGNPPQTAALHESFADVTAICLCLSQFDQIAAFIAMTKANLHAKNFLAALAERFGAALGRPMGLRNADNDLKLSQVSNEVQILSQVFTGAIYDVLADIFAFELQQQARVKGPAQILLEVNQGIGELLLKAIIQAPDAGATFPDVVNRMLTVSSERGDPAIYRTFIRNRFALREVIVSPTPIEETAMARGAINLSDPGFTDVEGDITEVEPRVHPSLSAEVPQDRSGTCGTIQLPEYRREQHQLDADLWKLREKDEPISQADLLAEEIKELKREFT